MKRPLMFALVVLAAASLLAADEPPAHKTDWMHRGKWGVMFHYTSAWQNLEDPKQWDDAIARFDAKGLAQQLGDVGAGWLLITAKHGGQNPLAPNSVYEAKHPGRCPKRDLIVDLADEFGKRKIRLMLYYATGMGVEPVPDNGLFTAKVIEEWSKRYGGKVSGWWLDNNVGNRDLQKAIADACRSGNRDALVAFSPPHNPQRNTPFDDYTAGNTHAPGMAACRSRFVDGGAQWHMLSYIGHNWAGYTKKSGGRWPVAKVAGFTKNIVDHGGAVTWDVKPLRSGLIAAEYLPYLEAVGKVGRR